MLGFYGSSFYTKSFVLWLQQWRIKEAIKITDWFFLRHSPVNQVHLTNTVHILGLCDLSGQNMVAVDKRPFVFSLSTTKSSTTSLYKGVSTRAAWVWSVWLSRIKKGMEGGHGTYSKTLCFIQVHNTDLNVLTVNSVCLSLCSSNRQWSIVTGRARVFDWAQITGEMMTLKSAGEKYCKKHSGQCAHPRTISFVRAPKHSLEQWNVLNNTESTNCYCPNHATRLYIHRHIQHVILRKWGQLISYLIHMSFQMFTKRFQVSEWARQHAKC